jgi:hypothetical protein
LQILVWMRQRLNYETLVSNLKHISDFFEVPTRGSHGQVIFLDNQVVWEKIGAFFKKFL